MTGCNRCGDHSNFKQIATSQIFIKQAACFLRIRGKSDSSREHHVQGSLLVIGPAGKKTTRHGDDGRVGTKGRTMKFLLKAAFWLTIVLILLPTGGSKDAQNSPEQQISASEAVSAASAAVSDMKGFCARQPDACSVGSQVAVALGHKAQAGAK